jgi:hypothetical protein
MLPFTTITGSQLPIAVSTAAVAFIQLLLNFNYINHKNYLLILIITAFVVLNILVFQNSTEKVLGVLIGYASIGISGLFIGSMRFSVKYLYRYGLILSVVNFALLFLNPFIKILSTNYMRFGYAMAPSLLFFGYEVFKNKNYKYLIFLIVGSIEIIVYGSRGSLLIVIIFVFLNVIFLGIKKIYGIALIGVLTAIIYFNESIVTFILEILTYFNIHSYSFLKYANMLEEGIGDVFFSGREVLYQQGFHAIAEKPFFGWGIGFDIGLSLGWVHSIILQMIIEYGFVGFSIVCFIILYLLVRIFVYESDELFLKVYIAIISVVIGRLLFSSDYWLRPEFWLLLSFSFNYIWHKNYLARDNRI